MFGMLDLRFEPQQANKPATRILVLDFQYISPTDYSVEPNIFSVNKSIKHGILASLLLKNCL